LCLLDFVGHVVPDRRARRPLHKANAASHRDCRLRCARRCQAPSASNLQPPWCATATAGARDVDELAHICHSSTRLTGPGTLRREEPPEAAYRCPAPCVARSRLTVPGTLPGADSMWCGRCGASARAVDTLAHSCHHGTA